MYFLNQSLLWDKWTKVPKVMYQMSLSKMFNKDDMNA